jgi:hypothetical protein
VVINPVAFTGRARAISTAGVPQEAIPLVQPFELKKVLKGPVGMGVGLVSLKGPAVNLCQIDLRVPIDVPLTIETPE